MHGLPLIGAINGVLERTVWPSVDTIPLGSAADWPICAMREAG